MHCFKFTVDCLYVLFSGNADRHHYETFAKAENHGRLMHIDSAKRYTNRFTLCMHTCVYSFRRCVKKLGIGALERGFCKTDEVTFKKMLICLIIPVLATLSTMRRQCWPHWCSVAGERAFLLERCTCKIDLSWAKLFGSSFSA